MERERERECTHFIPTGSLCKLLQRQPWSRLKQAVWNSTLILRVNVWGLSTWMIFCYFPRSISRELDYKQSSQESHQLSQEMLVSGSLALCTTKQASLISMCGELFEAPTDTFCKCHYNDLAAFQGNGVLYQLRTHLWIAGCTSLPLSITNSIAELRYYKNSYFRELL